MGMAIEQVWERKSRDEGRRGDVPSFLVLILDRSTYVAYPE